MFKNWDLKELVTAIVLKNNRDFFFLRVFSTINSCRRSDRLYLLDFRCCRRCFRQSKSHRRSYANRWVCNIFITFFSSLIWSCVLYYSRMCFFEFFVGDFYHDKIDHTNVNRMPKYRTLGVTVSDTLKKDVPNVLAWSSLGSVIKSLLSFYTTRKTHCTLDSKETWVLIYSRR